MVILTNTKDRFPFKLISYCLMPNHVHLQIKTEDVSTSEIMKWLNQRYASYFNKEYDLVGRIFQDRFKSLPIETENGMAHVSRYIHLNSGEGFIGQ